MKSISLLSVILASCSVHRPGEHEYQEYVIFGTPTYETALDVSTVKVQLDMISTILPGQKVLLVTNKKKECKDYQNALTVDYGVSATDLANLRCEVIEHTDIWFRDMGGVFVHVEVTDPSHSLFGTKSLAVVDYEFDGWAYGPYSDLITLGYYEVDDEVAAKLGTVLEIPVISSPMTTEGGAFVSNGDGTTLYTLDALTQRNPTWTQQEIEDEFRRTLGATTVLALPEFSILDGHSIEDGPLSVDTDGDGVEECYQLPLTVRHADNFVSFVDEDTLFVSQMDQADVRNSVDQELKDMLDRTWAFLEAETDFELIAFPEAGFIARELTGDDPIWQYLGALTPLPGAGTPCEWTPDGGFISLPSSYMNYVVTNTTVQAPQLYKAGRDLKLMTLDQEVMVLLAAMYPTRTVIGVDNEATQIGGGGMHCITQEVVALPTE